MKKILFLVIVGAMSLYADIAQQAREFKQKCDANDAKACIALANIYGDQRGLNYEAMNTAGKYGKKAGELCNDVEVCLRALDVISKYGIGEPIGSQPGRNTETQVRYSDTKAKLKMRICDEFNHVETCIDLVRFF